jgi:uncharacterized protein (TIGR03435 family)
MTARLLVVLGIALALRAQPKFEVVSIKACKNYKGEQDSRVQAAGARFTMQCYSVDTMIRNAYVRYASGLPWLHNPLTRARIFPLPPALLSPAFPGSTGWMKSDHFTVVAKSDRPAAEEMMLGPMMQKVLEDRFHLKLRREQRELKVFELVVGKGATPKLQASKPGGCVALTLESGPPSGKQPLCGRFSRVESGGVDVQGVMMGELCMLLSLNAGRDVLDKTGLTGVYDLHLDVSLDQLRFGRGDDPAEAAAALASALRKIGLGLQAGKMTAETLTIEHVERPTEN